MKRRIAAGAATAVVVIGVWATGLFDYQLAHAGLNARECGTAGFGVTFCGDAYEAMKRRAAKAKQEQAEAKRAQARRDQEQKQREIAFEAQMAVERRHMQKQIDEALASAQQQQSAARDEPDEPDEPDGPDHYFYGDRDLGTVAQHEQFCRNLRDQQEAQGINDQDALQAEGCRGGGLIAPGK